MKKTISFLLAVLLLCSVASVPMTALGAKKVKVDALYDVQVFPNNGRKGELRVCYGGFELDGVQVYRSETGEKGTYKKVGTTRNSTFFVDDQGLKNNKRYFYAVRPFIKKNGKTYFGPFTKADGWTMLTAAYATKLLKKAYRVAAKWMQGSDDVIDYSRWIERPLPDDVEIPGGEPGSPWWFFPVKSSQITTKKALKKYLHRYFASDRIDEMVDAFYFEFGGKLYIICFDNPMDSTPMPDEDRVVYVTSSGPIMGFVTIRKSQDSFSGIQSRAVIHQGYFEGDRWIFTDDNWGMDIYSTAD